MKKILLLTALFFLSISITNITYAQKSVREQRRTTRNAENQALDAQLAALIKSKDFEFIATEIVYGQNPMLQNITLNALYGIWVRPSYFKVYLPLYGPNNFNGMPSLMHRLDFFVDKYTFKIEPMKDGQNNVIITATDPWSINQYTFNLRITANGNYSYMTVQTPFVGPVSYNGNVQSN